MTFSFLHVQVQERMGYCPQFDALVDEMTVKETLKMYGRLRGIQEQYLPQVVDTLINSLLLDSYANTQAGMLRYMAHHQTRKL